MPKDDKHIRQLDSLEQFIPRVTVDGQTWQPDASIYLREVAVAAARAGIQPASKGLPLERVGELLDPGYLAMETGWARLDNGLMYVAAHTPMPGVTGEMIDWWFSWPTSYGTRVTTSAQSGNIRLTGSCPCVSSTLGTPVRSSSTSAPKWSI
jgi:hypothetical protein